MAQQLLDRVLARVGDSSITLTDVRAAQQLGVLGLPAEADETAALERMVERRLVLAEIARFPQDDPEPADVDAEVARMTAAAGTRLESIKTANGVDDRRLRDLARETVRIRAYLDQRFPSLPATSADAQAYYKAHPEEFSRDGGLLPYQEAEPAARAAAAGQARDARISRWMENLRRRIDVTAPRPR